MHLFLRDRRPRWLSALLGSAAVLAALAVALAWLRIDLPELHDVVAGWNGPEAQSGADASPAGDASAGSADIGSQIALARTYAELGQRADGLQLLERLALQHPQDGEIAFARASLLGQGSDPNELETAYDLYDVAVAHSPRLGTLARLHQGVIRARLGDADGALRIWRQQLALQPEEPYRSLFEEAIARAGVTLSDG